MSAPHIPRTVTSVLVEENADSVTVTWGLGDPVETPAFDYFGYGMYYYDPTGNRGKRFSVRISTKIIAWIFDNESVTQANYLAGNVLVTADAVVVHYRDASLGLLEIGTIAAYAHIEGRDEQLEIPVSLLHR